MLERFQTFSGRQKGCLEGKTPSPTAWQNWIEKNYDSHCRHGRCTEKCVITGLDFGWELLDLYLRFVLMNENYL